MQFDIKNEEDRNKLSYEAAFYNMTLEYQSMKKFLYIPEEYITEGGFPIGRVWAELRDDYDQNRLGGGRGYQISVKNKNASCRFTTKGTRHMARQGR